MMAEGLRARVSMFIRSNRESVYDAFIEPDVLTKFWLSEAEAPLALGTPVRWAFLVEGAEAWTTATKMERGAQLSWEWPDSSVDITFDPFEDGTAVTLINRDFDQAGMTQIESALNATEGFAIVLADLKTLLEIGASAGITAAKAKLIKARD